MANCPFVKWAHTARTAAGMLTFMYVLRATKFLYCRLAQMVSTRQSVLLLALILMDGRTTLKLSLGPSSTPHPAH